MKNGKRSILNYIIKIKEYVNEKKYKNKQNIDI